MRKSLDAVGINKTKNQTGNIVSGAASVLGNISGEIQQGIGGKS